MSQSSIDHPFSVPLEELTQDELDKRFNDLMTRFNAARRMQMDQNILHQIDLLLVSIENERARRNSVADKADGVVLDTDPLPTEKPKFIWDR